MAKPKNETQQRNGGEHQGGKSVAPYSRGGMLSRGGAWPLTRLRTEFDRLFDDFFRGWGGLPAISQEMDTGWGLDVEDQEDKIVVRAEAPGFEPDDFDLQIRNDQLVLSASQQEEDQQDGGRHWRRRELCRSVLLPSDVDAENVDAQYRNGILTVTLPKTDQGKSRRIEVKS